jgi:hypothetical protein
VFLLSLMFVGFSVTLNRNTQITPVGPFPGGRFSLEQ